MRWRPGSLIFCLPLAAYQSLDIRRDLAAPQWHGSESDLGLQRRFKLKELIGPDTTSSLQLVGDSECQARSPEYGDSVIIVPARLRHSGPFGDHGLPLR